jgi:hypothetical protein
MKHKLLLSQVILATAIVFLTCAASFGQCTITVTDEQPYIEDFEGDGFECWTVEIDGGSWVLLAGTESTVASFSYHDNGDEARLVSPVLDMSAVESATFSFSYAMMGFYEYDELEACYRSSEDDEWHILGTYSLSDYNNIYEEIFELENLSATYQVSFLGRGLGGMYIFVDNIEIASSVSCARPVSLQATDITAFSALISWSTTGNEESWTINLNDHERTVTEQPYLLEGLMPETLYTFSIRANCGESNVSGWAVPYSFTTLCDVITVTDEEPYFDDFEASEDFLCWQSEIISGEDGWVIDPGYLILNNTAFFIWMGEEAMLVSAPLDITAVTTPTLTFKHGQHELEQRVDELSVWYATSMDDDWHLLGNYTNACEDWETVALALPDASATYRIAFKGKSNNADGVHVDDVWVGNDPGVGVNEQLTLVATVSPNPTTGRVMVETNANEGEVIVFDMLGKQLLTAPVMEGHAELDLSAFAEGVYVARVSTEVGTSTVKVVKE